MKLAVVTHTNPDHKRDISRCIESVQEALPANGFHALIEFKGSLLEMQKARYEVKDLADIIVFVDDDDYITSDSLSKCLSALEGNDYGLAFTNESVKKIDGNIISIAKKPTYESIIKNPETAHHMSAMRTSCISDQSLQLALECGCGIEWIMKAEAAICHGAVHISDYCYTWVEHEGQHHIKRDVRDAFIKSFGKIKHTLNEWAVFHGTTHIVEPGVI